MKKVVEVSGNHITVKPHRDDAVQSLRGVAAKVQAGTKLSDHEIAALLVAICQKLGIPL
jgi:hypothetical protein